MTTIQQPIIEVNPSELTISRLNVRKRKFVQDVDKLAQDIQEQGQLQPIIVRREGEKLAVIAGQRRLDAIKLLNKKGDEILVRVVVVECDDAQASKLSMSENFFQSPMTGLQNQRAFAGLVKKGVTVEEIANQYSMPEDKVRKTLAIGNLPDAVIAAYEADDLCTDGLQYLAIANKSMVKQWLDAHKEGNAPRYIRDIKRMFNPDHREPMLKHALFDVEQSGLATLNDLFSENATVVADYEAFWELQHQSIDAAKDDLIAKGWEVEIYEAPLYSWEWVKTSKADGGRTVIFVSGDGEVEIVKGLLTEKEHQAKTRKEEKRAGGDTSSENVAGEVTNKMGDYLNAYALSQVRAQLHASYELSLRTCLAMVLTQSGQISIDRNHRYNTIADQLTSDQVEQSPEAIAANEFIAESLNAVGYDPEQYWQNQSEVRANILTMPIEAIQNALQAITMLSLSMGDALNTTVYFNDKKAPQTVWNPVDHTEFFEVINGKGLMIEMLKELNPKSPALESKVKVSTIRETLKTEAANNPDWRPKYFSGEHYFTGKGNPLTSD